MMDIKCMDDKIQNLKLFAFDQWTEENLTGIAVVFDIISITKNLTTIQH